MLDRAILTVPTRALGPDTRPAPGLPLRCRTSEFEGCGAEETLTQSAPTRTPAPAPPPALQPETHLGRERRGGRVPRGSGRSRWPSLGSRAAGYSPRTAEAGERGPARGRRGAGLRALGRLPGRHLPSDPRAAPRSSARDRGRRVRVPPAGRG
ncbi:unnamed protein product [Rangifer tarandus platyrhynchus]|uniref:Uncharacterized protein n=1 Tax=Rangifer tarandus platyrhynchus TaxID=3082113 RepID=A0ABN8ZZY4_RANTA|nr:unnamed protein product [Rangifer tarandus platyrhynchus]